MILKLKQIINFINRVGGIDAHFDTDETDRAVESVGLDEPTMN